MKNIKKIIIPVLILLIIVTILFLNNQNRKTNNTKSNNINNSSTSSNKINDEYKSNFNGENAVIYLGTHAQYEPFTIVLDKNLSNEDLAKSIIKKISSITNYKIELNSLTISNKNIYIDFSKDYAPFNIENSRIDSENTLYSIYGNDNIVYTIFNSIYKSLITYFGNEYNIYFSTNSENININFDNFTFTVDASKPFKRWLTLILFSVA